MALGSTLNRSTESISTIHQSNTPESTSGRTVKADYAFNFTDVCQANTAPGVIHTPTETELESLKMLLRQIKEEYETDSKYKIGSVAGKSICLHTGAFAGIFIKNMETKEEILWALNQVWHATKPASDDSNKQVPTRARRIIKNHLNDLEKHGIVLIGKRLVLQSDSHAAAPAIALSTSITALHNRGDNTISPLVLDNGRQPDTQQQGPTEGELVHATTAEVRRRSQTGSSQATTEGPQDVGSTTADAHAPPVPAQPTNNKDAAAQHQRAMQAQLASEAAAARRQRETDSITAAPAESRESATDTNQNSQRGTTATDANAFPVPAPRQSLAQSAAEQPAPAEQDPGYMTILNEHLLSFQSAVDAIDELPALTTWEKVKTLFGFGPNLVLRKAEQTIDALNEYNKNFNDSITTIKNSTAENETKERIAQFKAQLSAIHGETLQAAGKNVADPGSKWRYIGKRIAEQLFPTAISSLVPASIGTIAATVITVFSGVTAAFTLSFVWPIAAAGAGAFLLFMGGQAIVQSIRAAQEHAQAVRLHQEYNAIMEAYPIPVNDTMKAYIINGIESTV